MEDFKKDHLYFASESVGEGHPDKLCDQISDSVLDACLKINPNAKVAMESATKTGMVSSPHVLCNHFYRLSYSEKSVSTKTKFILSKLLGNALKTWVLLQMKWVLTATLVR